MSISETLFYIPESVVHPTGYVEDMDAEDCNDMQEAAKKVLGRVADIIETQLLKIRISSAKAEPIKSIKR